MNSRSSLVSIYEIHFLSKKINLLTYTDVENFIKTYKSLLTPCLLNSMKITTIKVDKNSNIHLNAVKNSNILYIEVK